MDGSTAADQRKNWMPRAVARRGRLGVLRRRSFLAGLVSLVLMRSVRATAVEPSTYGHGYRGGYR